MFNEPNTRLITDPGVFGADWVPNDFQFRRGEFEAMSAVLEPLLDTSQSNNLFIWGPSGAGKTSAVTHLLDGLRAERGDVTTLSTSCWTNSTKHAVLYGLLSELGATRSLNPNGPSSTALLDHLETTLETPAVVVLDEVDQLTELEILFDLYQSDGVTLVLISNTDNEFFARMDERLRSRFQHATRVEFDRYRTDELVGILSQRVRAGMRPSAVTESHLHAIADAAIGNARDAIQILETAARLAERRGQESLSDDIIAEAAPKARATLHEQTVERLSGHQLTLYEIIEEAGEIKPGAAYEQYQDAVEDPRSKRTVRNYVTKLAHYDLIEIVGENRGRLYRHLDPGDSGSSRSDDR
jgi:Cdc6-like AAA superfamily ATPase